jgi:hypothetical protein
MTKKDLFRLVIKIFGLYLLVSIIFSLPGNLLFSFNNFELSYILILLLFLILSFGLFLLIIYYTDFFIKLLKLEKGFDEERIDLANFKSSNILKLAVVIIGGILIIKNIPAFLTNTFFAFKSSVDHSSSIKFVTLHDYIQLVTPFLYILVGILLITNYKIIARFLDKRIDE